jgi:hypothetical protein
MRLPEGRRSMGMMKKMSGETSKAFCRRGACGVIGKSFKVNTKYI